MKLFIPLLFIVFLLTGCSGENGTESDLFFSWKEIESPASKQSGQPFLYNDGDGNVYLSWIEPGIGNKHAFRFASFIGNGWSEPVTIAEGDEFFVNWADVPSIFKSKNGMFAAHWLQSSGEWIFAYDVKISLSDTNGTRWSVPFSPHHDGTKTEHGFASFFDHPDGGIGIVWLDGREAEYSGAAGEGHASEAGWNMHLRSTVIQSNNYRSEEILLDDRVCECCPTAAVETKNGVLVAYRDRTEDEIRDISLVRFEDGGWTAPYPLYEDGWNIAGCPVNGPALSAIKNNVTAAWYTAADNDARVYVAFSDDGGISFNEPVRVDNGLPAGRVAIEQLDDGSAIIMWVEILEEDAGLMVRRVHPDGTSGDAEMIASVNDDRSSGFPRVARIQDTILFAWVDSFDENEVRTARAVIKE